jgi:hypothetical protein
LEHNDAGSQSRVEDCIKKWTYVIFGAGESRRSDKNGGVNQYTPDNGNELFLESEQLIGAECSMNAPESRDV